MRQGHQNRRGRGRGNNGGGGGQHNQNRKGQNPLTRTFESNGPDVKIRGTPAHIAEKYISLARDAKSSGDEVLAENYLQHAEHYNRIILAFREQQISQGGGDPNAGMGQRFRVPQLQDGPDDEDFNEESDDIGGGEQPIVRMNEPQPNVGGAQPGPYEGGGEVREPREPREPRDHYRQDYRQDQRHDHRQDQRHDRQDRHQGGHRFDDRQRRNDHFRNRDRDRDRDRDRHGDFRQQGGERPMERDRDRDRQFDRPAPPPLDPMAMQPDRVSPQPAPQPMPPAAPVAPANIGTDPGFEAPVNGQRAARPEAAPRAERPERDENAAPPRRRDRFQSEQPEFLRRPVRRPRREAAPAESADGEPSTAPPAPRDDTGPVE